jgi:hypothetical protein
MLLLEKDALLEANEDFGKALGIVGKTAPKSEPINDPAEAPDEAWKITLFSYHLTYFFSVFTEVDVIALRDFGPSKKLFGSYNATRATRMIAKIPIVFGDPVKASASQTFAVDLVPCLRNILPHWLPITCFASPGAISSGKDMLSA